MVWREDSKPLDHDEFWDKFTEFVEANGWLTGGGSANVDLNSDENYLRILGIDHMFRIATKDEYQGQHRKVQKE